MRKISGFCLQLHANEKSEVFRFFIVYPYELWKNICNLVALSLILQPKSMSLLIGMRKRKVLSTFPVKNELIA